MIFIKTITKITLTFLSFLYPFIVLAEDDKDYNLLYSYGEKVQKMQTCEQDIECVKVTAPEPYDCNISINVKYKEDYYLEAENLAKNTKYNYRDRNGCNSLSMPVCHDNICRIYVDEKFRRSIEFREEFKELKACNTTSDCMFIGAKPPLGCAESINKSNKGKFEVLLSKYGYGRNGGVYQCPNMEYKAICDSSQCKAVMKN